MKYYFIVDFIAIELSQILKMGAHIYEIELPELSIMPH